MQLKQRLAKEEPFGGPMGHLTIVVPWLRTRLMLPGMLPIPNSLLQFASTLESEWSRLPEAVGSQLTAALISGLLLAFGLQFLLTNFGVAIGISLLRFRSPQSAQIPQTESTPNSLLPKPSVMAGLGILSTINVVLFAACFLAVRFSQVRDPVSGAILGSVIWAAYCLILLWLSTSAATSLFSTALGFTTTGISGLITLIRTVLKPQKTVPALDEVTLAAIRQQIQLTLDQTKLQWLDDNSAKPPRLNWEAVQQDLRALLQQPEIQLLSDQWRQLDRAALTELIQQRLNLSTVEVNRIVDVIEQTGSEVNPTSGELQSQLELYLRHTAPKRLTPKRVERKLHKLMQSLQVELEQQTFNLPELEVEPLKDILKRRKSLSSKQQRQILQQIQGSWYEANQMQVISAQTDDQVDDQANNQAMEPTTLEPELSPDELTPEELTESPEPSSLEAIEVLLASLTAYFSPLSKLPYVSDRLKQYLKDWFTELWNNPSIIEMLWEQMSVEQLDENKGSYLAKLQPWRERLQSLTEEILPDLAQVQTHVSETAQSYLQAQVETAKQQISQPIEAVQHYLQSQIGGLKRETQQRLEATRQAAATAAWWLFTIVLTAVFSSMVAGALATGGLTF